MVISGLVLTLCEASPHVHDLCDRLRADARFTLGPPAGHRLPLVAEASDSEAAERIVDELRRRAGVLNVDVAFVEIDPDDAASRSGSAFGRRRSDDRSSTHLPTAAPARSPQESFDAHHVAHR